MPTSVSGINLTEEHPQNWDMRNRNLLITWR